MQQLPQLVPDHFLTLPLVLTADDFGAKICAPNKDGEDSVKSVSLKEA